MYGVRSCNIRKPSPFREAGVRMSSNAQQQLALDLGVTGVEPILFPVGRRIASGVKFLDELEPDWRSKVNARRLDISNPGDCILGQIFGDFMDGCSQLRIEPHKEAARMGFNVLNPNSPMGDREFEALNRGWPLVLDSAKVGNLKRLKIAA